MAKKPSRSRPLFCYTKSQKDTIQRALIGARMARGADWPKLLSVITDTARTALVKQALAEQIPKEKSLRFRPYAGESKRQLQLVADKTKTLLETCKALHPSTEGLLISYLANHYVEPGLESDLRPLLRLGTTRLHLLLSALYESALEAAVSLRHRPHLFPRTGRHKEEAIHWFLLALCGIYHEATGKVPSVGYNDAEGRVAGHFYNFAAAALSPLAIVPQSSIGNHVRKVCQYYRGVLLGLSSAKVKTPSQ